MDDTSMETTWTPFSFWRASMACRSELSGVVRTDCFFSSPKLYDTEPITDVITSLLVKMCLSMEVVVVFPLVAVTPII